MIKNTIKSNTQKWHDFRHKILSASDISVVLDSNVYKPKDRLILEKRTKYISDSNINTLHGQKFEPLAINFFEKKFNCKVYECGLKIHPKYDFLGATPDGIFEYNNEISLLEVKCPLKRKIDGKISFNYFCQMQLQMEVWNINSCYFIETEFREYESQIVNKKEEYYKKGKDNKFIYLNNINIVKIPRDNEWFNNNLSEFKKFHNLFKNERKEEGKRKMPTIKRKFSEISGNEEERSEKGKKKGGINVSDAKHYINGDKLQIWLNNHGTKYFEKKSNKFNELIIEKHQEFYQKQIDFLNTFESVFNVPKYDQASFDKVIELSKRIINSGKYDVIINPTIIDKLNRFYVNIPVLLKGSFIKQHYQVPFAYLSINDNMYYPIEITCSKLELNMDTLLSSSDKNYLIESNVLSQLLKDNGIENNSTFIINQGIKHDKKYHSGLYQVTHFEWSKFSIQLDNFYSWYNKIVLEENLENIKNNPEYFPLLLSDKYSDWEHIEKQLGRENHELTEFYKIGQSLREKIRQKNVFSWKDPKFYNTLVSLKVSTNTLNTIKNLLDFNNNENGDLVKILNKKNSMNWIKKKNPIEFYVDFETVNEFCSDIDMIYMIGVHIVNNIIGEESYKNYMSKGLNWEEEKNIIMEWKNDMDKLCKEYGVSDSSSPVYHWSSAERVYINRFEKRTGMKFNFNWIDMHNGFIKNQILVKGNIYGYSIKHIVKFLHKNGLITRYYNCKCSSGDKSIVSALKYYNDNDLEELNDLIEYNKLDCVLMSDIMTVLRNIN